MRKTSLFLGLIFLISAFTSQGQIVTKYQQGFEATGETQSYTIVQGSAAPVTNVASSGGRSLKLSHSSQEVIIMLDTLDFTDNGSFQYFYLEFMHICDVNYLAAGSATEIATIEMRRTNETDNDWTPMDGNDHYDNSWGGGSDEFVNTSSFSRKSYIAWQGVGINNTWWKRERFKLALKLVTVPQEDRKLLIRFRLRQRTVSGATNEGWYLDNIKVQASPNSMLLPILTMKAYPDMDKYPTSRGTHLAAKFTTPLSQGMCSDSIYVDYQLGHDGIIRRNTMTAISGQPNCYETYLPFCGYDTIVKWRMVGKDNTVNHNMACFPMDEGSWMTYSSVRGKQAYSQIAEIGDIDIGYSPGTTNEVPFPNLGDYKCEITFDSTEMSKHFKAGAITQIRYPVVTNVNGSTRNRFVVKMKNVGTDFAYSSENDFTTDYQKTVYDSSLVITQNAQTLGYINLQDTFFYGGKGLMITMYSDNTNNDPSAVWVRTFNAPSGSINRGSLFKGYQVSYGIDPFTSSYFVNTQTRSLIRPNFTLRVNENAPLLHDCGIKGFIHPNDTTPAVANVTNNVEVILKNYGALAINAVRIYYSVDNGAHQYFDWTGNLPGGGETSVVINTTQTYAVGYHEIVAWVEDSVTAGGIRYRDHEPFNDTSRVTPFITCDGPMHGTRVVGGSTPDYQSLAKLLFALSQCGVDGPLTVKLAPGYYTPHTFPVIPGISKDNYVKFEPLSGQVTFVSSMHDTALVNTLVNLQQTHHVRFHNINFWSNAQSNPVTYLVRMGTNSVGCQFDSCFFSEVQGGTMSESYMAASALLYSGGADSLLVNKCFFNRGTAGISLVGPAQDNMAHGSIIRGCSFQHQGTNSMIVRNQIGAIVDSNTCDEVYANSSYAILLQDCSGATKVTRNTVYVTSGASCIGATQLYGSATGYAIVANNMLVSNDEGTSNMLTTPLNIITADYVKVLHNSVKLTAPTRSGIAAATFGGGVLENSMFYNNIVACYDTVNFAFNFIPTENATNYIGYNIYYSRGPLLNKYDGINCLSFTNWESHCPTDGNSQNVNPAFLNSTLTDLRSYSQNVKAHGVPFSDVTIDIFGTQRDSVAPCVGAFEFSSLPYDFEILEFLEPFDSYCDAPTAAPIRVVIKNSGINAFDPSTSSTSVQLTYSRGTTPGVMVPGASGNMIINRTIRALDTIILTTSLSVPLPTNGLLDTTYHLFAWLTSTVDPNPANDTSEMTITSNYHATAPDSLNVTSDYGTPATVTATGGLQGWYSNVYTASTQHKSEVYWYLSSDADSAIWRGNTFTTDPLYTDTTFYIRQKRDYGLVKISEVMIKQNNPGVTYPMPLWMNSSTSFAIEFMNVGDYPVNLMNDTVMIISNTGTYNNKIYKFPNVTIQPGKCLVLQYRTINNVDSTLTLGTSNLTPPQTANLGILYYHKGVIEDAVAINNITTQNQWTNKNVPTSSWFGPGISLPDSIPTAGVYRKSWPQYPNSLTQSIMLWETADDSHKMTLGTPNKNLVRYYDNGCLGEAAPVHITLINLPDVDMALDNLNITDGCGMSHEPITLSIHNRGAYNSGQLVMHYKVEGYPQYAGQAIALQTGCDTIANMGPSSSLNYTFNSIPDFTVASASVNFDVTVWVEKVTVDNTGFNDTVRMSLTSLFMPDSANVKQYDTVAYDGTLTLQSIITPPTDSLAWYDRNLRPLDTCNVYTTGHIYRDDTIYVSTFGARINEIHLGTLASVSGASAYPSPYNPKKKYIKEQYLYTAEELIAAGHTAGPIQTVAFYLDTILSPAGTMTFTDYVISFGTTAQSTFTANNNWLAVTTAYTADTLTLTNAEKGWITHNLNTAFHWNGTDNIVVQVTRSINPAITQGAKTRYTSAGNSNRVIYKNDDNNDLVSYSSNGARSGNRPDVQFGFVDYGCEGPKKPIYITVTDIPASDAALEWAASDTAGYTSCDTTDLIVSVHNMGVQSFNSYTIDYWIDTLHGVYTGTQNIGADTSIDVTVTSHLFTPGRHDLRLAVTLTGDTVQSNDTISRTLNVRFCAGHYTIGPNGMFANFTTAINTLYNAGIDGPVVFDVENGTYLEQINLGTVDGVSAINTITFRGDTADRNSVILRYAPTNANNYVINLENAKFINFEYLTFLSRGTSNYSNVVTLSNSNQIRFKNDIIRVKGGLNNANASCMVVGTGVTSLYVDNCVLDSGYYSIRSLVPDLEGSSGVYVSNDTLRNFMFMGLYMRKVNDVYAVGNSITSGATSNGKALTGIFVAQHNGPTTIERNNIVLNDNFTGAKTGIRIVNVDGSNATRTHIHNNMCAIYGGNNNSSAGISIDSSTWINAYFNTCQVYAGTGSQGQSTKAMYVGTTSSGLYILNNILSNISAGYAFYAQLAANVSNADYNVYWSSSETRLAYWAGEDSTLLQLRQANSMDNHSMNSKPYFLSNTDLHLSLGGFCERAQYNTETPLDIDGEIRPQIPNPTIGADEFFRSTHNIAIMEILKPGLKTYATQTTGFTDNIESDTLWVVAKFTNDGTSTESNLRWWAEVANLPTLRSSDRIFTELLPQEEIIDSNYIVMPIGIIDTQTIIVHFPLANDAVPENNVAERDFFLDPAYNFMAEQVRIYDSIGCRLYNTPVGVKLKNVGRKTFPAGWQVPVGFEGILNTTGVTISTLPVSFVENLTLPFDVEPNESVILDFNTTPNLYPTGNDKDIVVRIRAWSSHQYDQKPLNDTTTYLNVNSYYTPRAPIGTDLHIPYATWDTIFATQTDYPPAANPIHRNIRWHRDSTDAPYFTANNYARSCWWETPQYFHDSTYFLSCVVSHNNTFGPVTCTSYYNPVHVYLNPRVPVDMAVLDVVEPVGTRVYMTNDSVKIALINYGSQPVTNIPVVYQFYNSSNVLLQEVHETCPATIQPDSVYVYRFDSLLSIPNWSSTAAYHLRVWTDMPNENVRLNDTLRDLSYFYAVPDGIYMEANVATKPGLDITRVAFSSLDNDVSPSGNKYINFVNSSLQCAAINVPSMLAETLPDYGGKSDGSYQGLNTLRALHLVKGTVDTMIVECQNSDRSNDFDTRGWLSIWIDVNRDGHFEYMPLLITDDSADYSYPYTEIFYQDTIISNIPKKFLFTLPESIRTGYMRMRVVVDQGSTKPKNVDNFDEIKFGCVHDYLLYVEDRPDDYDLCASRIVSSREQHIGGHTSENADSSVVVTFQIANKGRLPINGATVKYSFRNPRYGNESGSLQWNEILDPGHSATIDLPPHVFSNGTTNLVITVSTLGDTITFNDTLYYQYYRAPIKYLVYTDDFEGLSDWFIPRGYTPYSQNLWQRGQTQKSHIMASVSDSSIMATNLKGFVNVYNTGNVSYAYTPIFDIHTIRPDTLDLWIARDMAEGHLARLEFCDYLGRWVTVGTGNDSLWYNSGSYWDSVSSGYGYQHHRFPLSLIGSDFQQMLQFRLVYKAESESPSCDGIAIDDFVVGRARRNLDVGVIAITHPTQPKFGQTIYPRVIIKNYGTDTIYSVTLAYLPYGVNLSRIGTYESTTGIMPGSTDIYEFPTPFIVRNDFPDTFQICAFTTVNMDMYPDNDSICSEFYLSPLDNDMGMVELLSPRERVIAGDSITVTTRIRNYGQAPVHSTTVTYVYNNNFVVNEEIDFESILGHDLQSFEFLNYSFKQKFRASMGYMDIMAYVNMPNDDYVYNDTIIKRIEGLSAITDLQATEVIVDTSNHNWVTISVVVDNIGARAANDFKIGFWYYKDTSTLHEAIYHGETPLPALSRLCYVFPDQLERHEEYYKYVTAYVTANDDNDRSNDTTSIIAQPYIDIRPIRVVVEENRTDSCRVRMEIENLGNAVTRDNQDMNIEAVINGVTIRSNGNRRAIHPGTFQSIEFSKKVPKSPTRTYVGTGSIRSYLSDENLDNNQTTVIDVLNYFEGIPLVSEANGMVLQQNYPNPFDNSTRIEFYLPTPGDVRFFVMDELGRLVYQNEQYYSSGNQSINFGDGSLSTGAYYYGIEKDGERLMRKMVMKR